MTADSGKSKNNMSTPSGVDIIMKKDPILILTQGIYLWPSTYVQDMREIPAIITEKIVIKC